LLAGGLFFGHSEIHSLWGVPHPARERKAAAPAAARLVGGFEEGAAFEGLLSPEHARILRRKPRVDQTGAAALPVDERTTPPRPHIPPARWE